MKQKMVFNLKAFENEIVFSVGGSEANHFEKAVLVDR